MFHVKAVYVLGTLQPRRKSETRGGSSIRASALKPPSPPHPKILRKFKYLNKRFLQAICTFFKRNLTKLFKMITGVTLDAGLLARSQYSEGPATGHLDTGFSWFPCVYKQTLRWLPTFQVATTCFSCSPPDLKLNVSVKASYFC
jgi:hypothetical protein